MSLNTSFIAKTAIIGDNVKIGQNCKISDNVIIRDGVTIGDDCVIHPFAVIGENPQDKSFKGELTEIVIGHGNIIREFVTIHKPIGEGNLTLIGNDNYFMSYSHIGHNCCVANNVTMANAVQLGGHSQVDDFVNIGGGSTIHQHCHIGTGAMLSGLCGTSKDLPPYLTYFLAPAKAIAVNRVGLKRQGVSQEVLNEIFKIFKITFKKGYALPRAIEILQSENFQTEQSKVFINFLINSKRGVKIA